MKKLLNLLAVTVITTSSSASVIACGHKGGGSDNGEITKTERQMLDSAKFMSQLILSGRHENLNYNVNEILSMYLTPKASAQYMPVAYDYNGKRIDISSYVNDYKSLLAPGMSTFDQDHHAGFYASYIMGMYDDNFYNKFVDTSANGSGYFEDTFGQNGATGYNQKRENAMGFAAGLKRGLKLSNDKERRNLAWGIQDTGALTNYLLDNGYDGGYPSDVAGSKGPAGAASPKSVDEDSQGGGTNSGGYLYYNSETVAGSSGYNGIKGFSDHDLNKKVEFAKSNLSIAGTGSDLTYAKIQNKKNQTSINFGESGAMLANAAGVNNVQGHAIPYVGLINSIAPTDSGAQILGQVLNTVFPIFNDGSMDQQIGFNLFKPIINAIFNGKEKYETAKAFFDKLSPSNEIWNEGEKTAEVFNFSGTVITDLFKKTTDINDETAIQAIESAKDVLNEIVKEYKLASDSVKKEFNDEVLNLKGIIGRSYQFTMPSIVNQIGKDVWQKVLGYDSDYQGALDLISMTANALDALANGYKAISSVQTKYAGAKWLELSLNQQADVLEKLGWVNSEFKKDSFLYGAYHTLKDGIGSAEFIELLKGFANQVNKNMAGPHEKLLSNIYGDTWTSTNETINNNDNMHKGAKMSFKLDYEGLGDSTSNADQQKTQYDVPENFNPYQTIATNQDYAWGDKLKETGNQSLLDVNGHISGKVLAKEQDQSKWTDDALKVYDGTGMLENMRKVHHTYKVTWENISSNEKYPYWIITSIHSYNVDANGKETEFFNIY